MGLSYLPIDSKVVSLTVAGEILGVEANRKSRLGTRGPDWLPLRVLTSIEQASHLALSQRSRPSSMSLQGMVVSRDCGQTWRISSYADDFDAEVCRFVDAAHLATLYIV